MGVNNLITLLLFPDGKVKFPHRSWCHPSNNCKACDPGEELQAQMLNHESHGKSKTTVSTL